MPALVLLILTITSMDPGLEKHIYRKIARFLFCLFLP